jgi:hypothetical protein
MLRLSQAFASPAFQSEGGQWYTSFFTKLEQGEALVDIDRQIFLCDLIEDRVVVITIHPFTKPPHEVGSLRRWPDRIAHAHP